MDTTDFTTEFSVDATPDEVFAAINNVRGWWSGTIDGQTAELGDEFTYRYEDLHHSTQRVVESSPGRRIVWRVLDSQIGFVADPTEWTGTNIIFEITEAGDQTNVRFTHAGLAPQRECFDSCSNAWRFYVNTSLRHLISTGEDQLGE